MISNDMHSPAQERMNRVIRSTFIFDMARKFATATVSAGSVNGEPIPPEVSLSIITLGVTLQGAVQFLAKDLMSLQFDKMHPDLSVAFLGFEQWPAYLSEKSSSGRSGAEVKSSVSRFSLTSEIYSTQVCWIGPG